MRIVSLSINFAILLKFVYPQSVPNVCFCATSGNCNGGTGTGTDGIGLWYRGIFKEGVVFGVNPPFWEIFFNLLGYLGQKSQKYSRPHNKHNNNNK